MSTFKPLRTQKFAHEIANQIKESIFDGTYSSGDKIPSESELAILFGVSKVSIRQAVRLLENTGILITKQGAAGGIFVAEADSMAVSSYLSDMLKLKRVTRSDLTMARLIFEPDISSLVATAWKGNDLENAAKNIQQAQVALKQNDLKAARLLNLAFHRILCEITGNPVIIFTLNSVIDVLEENIFKIKMGKDFVQTVISEHQIILDKIRARKRDEACEKMRDHVAAFTL